MKDKELVAPEGTYIENGILKFKKTKEYIEQTLSLIEEEAKGKEEVRKMRKEKALKKDKK